MVKTQQKHSQVHEIPLSFLCPVSAYTHMINLFPGKSTDPAFGLPNRQRGITLLSKHDIDCMLRSLFEKCGIDTTTYSFHSLMRGGAT